jgi:hypothetical protein
MLPLRHSARRRHHANAGVACARAGRVIAVRRGPHELIWPRRPDVGAQRVGVPRCSHAASVHACERWHYGSKRPKSKAPCRDANLIGT